MWLGLDCGIGYDDVGGGYDGGGNGGGQRHPCSLLR